MTTHTPEPWAQMGCGIYANKRLIACFGDDDDSGISAEIEQIATTKRAVDCVNGCKGINPDAVPGLVLLAEQAENIFKDMASGIERSCWEEMYQKAHAALTKAQPSK